MSEFQTRRLDEHIANGAVVLGRGDVISKEHISANPGPYPIYSSSAHNNGKFGEYGKYMFDEELISWSVDGGGYFFYRPKHKYSVTNVCGYMRLRTTTLDPKFVFYSLVNQHRFLTFDYTSKAHPSVIKKQYWLPTIAVVQQQKIATILTSIDTTIEKTEALIEKYQHIKAGLMHDLFTRGVLPNGQLRPPREQAPELYRETAIGWIPKEWEVVKLNEILNRIDAGWSPECQEIPPGAGEWGVLKVSAVTKGIFDPSESKTLPKHLPSDPTIEVAEGDIILTRANGVAELVGVTVQVRSTPTKLMLSDKLLRLVPNPIRMTKDFLYFSMCTSTIKSQIESVMSGSSGQRNISQAQIKNFDCVCPQAKEQTLISTALRKIERSVDREREITSKFLHQKLGLMQDLLSGKVEVKTTEAVVESMDG